MVSTITARQIAAGITFLLLAASLACGSDATNLPPPDVTVGPTAAPATATPRPTATPQPTATATPRPTATPQPPVTATPRPTATPQPPATATPRPTATPQPTATVTPRPTATPQPTATATPRPTATRRPTATPRRVVAPTRSTESYNFRNCTELRKVFPNGVPKGHPAYQSKMDRDKDDWACERS